MSRSSTLFIILLVVFAAAPLSAKKGESIFDRWSHTADKTIELHLDFDSLEANRFTNNEISGTVVDNGIHFTVDISVRGRYRRRTCAMPPIKLQFDKELLRNAGLNTHNDYKLVTHCTDDEDGQDAILREQLAYDLYRTVDPGASFRTKLLTIIYVNTADGSTSTGYAILIEDTDELKDRLGANNCSDCYATPLDNYDNIERVTLFQYMIGNADFSTRMNRNLKMMRTENGRFTAVPYDFDFSGLVNPTYSKMCLTERQFVWDFESIPNIESTAAEFMILKDPLMQQVTDNELLSDKSKREITKYLKCFFRDLKAGKVGV
ncbi:hypothetical protein GGR28_002080 [Lewinella aquimaris]|uniref:Uncharacterized protein n=1 Tax=Neolewinella aquimaris TaxID=1835722 RepID=A0A840E755_9BACT|nr:hypothetical protein [Neolewinella aquimaris]MBB4079455.1 hypothetical protein [Neolewinella aquimaris]